MSDWVRGEVIARHQWTEGLHSMRIAAPIADFQAGQYVKIALDIAGDRVGRPYSLVNPPAERPLEIYFNEVAGGPLTPRLSDLQPGDTLWVSGQAGGIFTLETVLPARQLWMLATGTALGVYLSMLRAPDPWARFEQVILVHGVRHAADLSYGEVLAGIAAERGARFQFVPLVSRESGPGALGGRITDRLRDGTLEAHLGLTIAPEASHVMLCGNSAMIKDVKAILEERGLVRHRRHAPGHYSAEQYH